MYFHFLSDLLYGPLEHRNTISDILFCLSCAVFSYGIGGRLNLNIIEYCMYLVFFSEILPLPISSDYVNHCHNLFRRHIFDIFWYFLRLARNTHVTYDNFQKGTQFLI